LLAGPKEGLKGLIQIAFGGNRCIFGLALEDVMRGVLKGHLPLEKGCLESNPHTHGDGGDSLIDVTEVGFDVVK
jgi:hypothetical protein